ncbi:hypothetical protein Daus18300_000437 [Diaporthe australafricana]|uniref:Protein kinase domain-containing protein n=1 Tax=Diaporthe australafricana TaxID=127596 RepID=A0ABR3Y4Z8_9PEZI
MMEPMNESDQWALLALNPSGERQLFVREVGSGYQSKALLFRELNGEKLSVHKVNTVPHDGDRMKRPDREVSAARLLSSSMGAARFAQLLSSQELSGGHRETWWMLYNLGSLSNLCMFMFAEARPPLSLVFRILGQCLQGIQSLNELGMRHFDLHTGNVFLTLNGEPIIMDAVLADFGYTRLPGEPAPAYTAWEWNLMGSKDHWGYSSPPGTYGPVNEFEDRNWRLQLDLSKFLYNFHEDFMENFDENDEGNSLLFELFKRLSDKNIQDDKDRKLPEAQRPPVIDLTQEIQDAQTLERLYAGTRADQEALGQLRVKLHNLVSEEPVDPLVFRSELDARDEFQSQLDTGLFRLVNLSDMCSIEIATAELAALRIPGTAYVSGRSDPSSSSTEDSASPTSSETRESTPAEQQSSPAKDTQQEPPVEENDEQRNSSPESHVSTRWTPATHGLAPATAFASGDASALNALLGARDVAERDHARSRRMNHFRRFFRR